MISCTITLTAQSTAQMRRLLDRAAKSAKRGLMVTLHESQQGRIVGDASIAFQRGGSTMYADSKMRAAAERAKKKATVPAPPAGVIPN